MTAVERFLERLEDVREANRPGRWYARCPAHDDRSPSLQIDEGADGVVLLWCWARCGAADIVAAIGLELSDLFPRNSAHRGRPIKRPKIHPRDALTLIDHEALIITIIASDVRKHRHITDDVWERLAKAAGRIGEVRDACAPLKVKP